MANKDSIGKQEFWKLFGWCLLWIGFGSCCMMTTKDPKTPLIHIEIKQ